MLEYHAAYYKTENGWYVAEVLDYPGVVSQGRTLNSARRMIRDALRTMAEWDMEEGRPFPRPNPKVKSKDADYRETIQLKVQLKSGAGT